MPLDPTFARYLLPVSAYEVSLGSHRSISISRRRIYTTPQALPLEGEEVYLVPAELDSSQGRQWVFYQVWESVSAAHGPGTGCDIVVCHGLNEYGGRYAMHMISLIQAGFRVIAMDMPSHGRSTGVHGHINASDVLPNAIFAVLTDIRRWKPCTLRKTFVYGFSLGGYSSVSYSLRYDKKLPLDGIFLINPAFGDPDKNEPKSGFAFVHTIVALFHYILKVLIGRWAIIPDYTYAITSNPALMSNWLDDPHIYHGKARISTAFFIVKELSKIHLLAPNFTLPIKIISGDRDRLVPTSRCQAFITATGSKDKEFKIYEGGEHLLGGFGVETSGDGEDRGMKRLIQERDDWFIAQAKMEHTIVKK